MNFSTKMKNLIFCRKKIFQPKKNKVLVIDTNFNFILKNLFKNTPEILDIRLNEINISVLLKLFFSNQKKTFFNYVILYIKITDPKHVITFNDNLNWFYKLKKKFPKKNFISFQNGFRTKSFFRELSDEKEHLSADLICTFNRSFAKEFKKKINCNTLVVGSIKNNLKKIQNNKKKRNSILLVSSGYPERRYFQSYNKKYYNYLSSKFYYNDEILTKNIVKFCKFKNLTLEISPKNKNDLNEYNYFKKIVQNNEFIYHNNSYSNMKTYDLADQVNMTVCSHTAFGFENLARGNKTVIFNNKKIFTKGMWDIFWYLEVKSKGFFWTDSLERKEIRTLLNKIYEISDYTWEKKTKNLIPELMYFDRKNEKLKKLKKILNS
jgi:surface carbohydrate biosynthesis protein